MKYLPHLLISKNMNRILFLAVALFAFLPTNSQHDKLYADEIFTSFLDASQVPSGSSTATGIATATFVLDTAEQNLSYSVQLNGLNLIVDPSNRTGFSDVDKIHLHNTAAGQSGPHVLNVFGLPSEDDSQLAVDFANNSLTGIYDDSDALDSGGNLFDQNSPLTTKLLSNFIDDLRDGQIYLAVHTAGQSGNIAIRGQLTSVPEPTSLALPCGLTMTGLARRRRPIR